MERLNKCSGKWVWSQPTAKEEKGVKEYYYQDSYESKSSIL